ncbi:butyrophilin-like protein 2 isoform X1 [Pantherophis guttatus]|uniref:Butyrophilin-like protein 2 isoform X1 n=1 Tax=Pantherophis guttatus TaxID=94885 RepID=A0A6P9B6X0_PANGU|nr:butyrophilin-like protein 2 isoform X1 [Pantherophis guttatus]
MASLEILIYPSLLLVLIYHANAMDVFRVRPFDNISLPCQFSFVDSTEGLSFTWEREDIKEEHEVEDDDFYKYFVGLHDFYQFYPKVIYSFSDNMEQVEERNSLYEGRVWVDEEEIPEGSLTLMLDQVQFSDEAMYICKAVNSHGRGTRKMKLVVEDAEEPQVQFSTVEDTLVAKCISAGWYHMPKVTWRNRKEEDLSGYSKTEILEEKQDGSHRVVSTLHYPVLLHEIYTCHIEESDVLNRPVRSIHKVPKRKYHNMYNHY